MIVKTTNHAEIKVPDTYDEDTKFWADILFDRVRMDELYGLIQLIREEAYNAGRADGFDEVCNFGPILEGSTVDQADGAGSTEQSDVPRSISGCLSEGPQCIGGNQTEVA